ncbi:MAG TPA: hypothetical protein HA276_02370 [Candidatus Poseidoniaceae archaeon]|nr:MAG TPA: hypothetical protein D7I01_02310 [Candidatus Poseidoniales archaeon]HII96513.1 hypothetical protein [Candidatus Poseidoniaceae archaeon]
MRQTSVAIALLCMLLASTSPLALATQGRSNGVDLAVDDVSFTYTTSADEGKYRMFSSNHPIPGFNRPASLFVIDAMVNVPIDVEVTVQNLGSVASSLTDVRLLLLHDEYQRFEIANLTEPLNSISASSSGIVTFQFTPTYAGNHSMRIEIMSATPDDNPNNDVGNRRMTVGAFYWNCDTLQLWSTTGEWRLNSDTSISMGSACHVGNGDTSTYSPNTISRLTTPPLNLADGLSSGTRTMGLSFFYTGSVISPDRFSVEAKTATGTWEELTGLAATVDQDFLTDGANWNTFSISSGGYASPLVPIAPDRHLHANSALRWTLTTDSSVEDIGFWMDEVVMVYDQAARVEAYAVSVQGRGTTGAVPGAWGSVDLRIVNDGNISTNIVPGLEGLPEGWDTYTTFDDGSSVPSTGFNLLPGTSRDISVRLKPDENASVGLVPMTFNGSTDHDDVHATGPMSFTVLADRVPVLVEPSDRPSCPAQQSCPFMVELRNEGGASDVFDLDVDTSTLPAGWNVDFAWSQPNSVLVRPGESSEINLLLTVPQNAQPDTVQTASLSATAQNDSTRVSTLELDVSASMVSDIGFTVINAFSPVRGGEHSVLVVELENLAERPDILALDAEFATDADGWSIESISRTQAVMTAGSTVSVTIEVSAPDDVMAGELAPNVRLLLASERSGMDLVSPWWSGPVVVEVREGSMTSNASLLRVMPGVPLAMPVSVSNAGNIDLNLQFHVDGLPESWSTWWRLSDVNVSLPLNVPVNATLAQPVSLELMFLAPSNAPAGVPIEMSLRSMDGDEELDLHPFEVVVEPVRKPGLTLERATSTVRSGGTVSFNGTVLNLGNAPDPSVYIEVRIQSTQDLSDMVTFFNIDGGAGLALDESHTIGLGTGIERVFRLDVNVPESAPLGTRIVVEVTVHGGLDEENRPYTIEMSHLIEVDQRRDVSSDWTTSPTTLSDGVPHEISLNFASSSSFEENLTVTFEHPESWAVVCDGIGALQAGTSTNVILEPGHIVTVERKLGCSVLRNGGPASGDLSVLVQTAEGTTVREDVQPLSWSIPVDQDGMSGQAMAFGGGIILLIVAIGTVLILRRPSDEDLGAEAGEASKPQEGPPITNSVVQTTTTEAPVAGPPVSAPTGPTLPENGLPDGWTMEQWQHYGQQWLEQQSASQQ